MQKLIVALFLIASMMVFNSAYAVDLTLYTEEFPPYNFTERKKVTGVSTEVVKEVMRIAGFRFKIKTQAWIESYNSAQKEPNALIYSISRRPHREKLFKWIGVIAPTTYSVYTLRSRSDIKVEDLSDLERYKAGVIIDSIAETWLLNNGFSKNDLLRVKGDNAAIKNFKNFINGRIDLWTFSDAAAYHIVKQAGHSKPELLIKKVYSINELASGFYMAASRNTSDATVTRIANALEKYKKTDHYFKTLAHWGVDAMGLRTTAPIDKLIYSLKNFKHVTKVGYLASDKLSAHREGGLYRKEIREVFVEDYAKTFDEWRKKFIKMQQDVDVLLIGDIKGIKGWNNSRAKVLVLMHPKVPTGSVLKGLADYTLISYEEDELILNKLVAKQLGLSFPKSYIRKAARVIEK